ncbi:hypothetical protein F2P81_000112 [Scophthalmus maximus]|uniref:Uncharacterized protein n=1 Tax=Scophthalmus maximus TaxID=52904 RepID=A0A6A4TNS2_SCOMX|nr:hypothetical protein F2P81_000112 [Scophthalmus maximus]
MIMVCVQVVNTTDRLSTPLLSVRPSNSSCPNLFITKSTFSVRAIICLKGDLQCLRSRLESDGESFAPHVFQLLQDDSNGQLLENQQRNLCLERKEKKVFNTLPCDDNCGSVLRRRFCVHVHLKGSCERESRERNPELSPDKHKSFVRRPTFLAPEHRAAGRRTSRIYNDIVDRDTAKFAEITTFRFLHRLPDSRGLTRRSPPVRPVAANTVFKENI